MCFVDIMNDLPNFSFYVQGLSDLAHPENYSRNREVFTTCIEELCKTFCTSPCTQTLELVTETTRNLVSLKGVVGQVDRTLQRIRNLTLPDQTKKNITRMGRARRGVAVIALFLRSLNGDEHHASLLVFDGYTRTQHFFNPWGYRNHWMNEAFARKSPLVEGFRVSSVMEDAWPTEPISLQYLYDNNGIANGGGNCVLYCIVVAAMCLRYQKGNPKEMADIFMEVSTSAATASLRKSIRGLQMRKLYFWVNSLNANVVLDTLSDLPGIIFPAPTNPLDTRCGVYCPKRQRYCKRRRCPEDIFCWQHRHLIRNNHARGSNRRRCVAPQAKCRALV
ncbi:unknown [Feldmannia species virus]|uniref:Uncharacterized protein n=1 Tax=Feldmannia species virus TaxID=39420 RepID=B5LWF5_9PHYC|nr:hypothetical protein FeldSpV_gp066 [Feldmannia species virus]ACH46818.1 unknown [Feldmannia species virus]